MRRYRAFVNLVMMFTVITCWSTTPVAVRAEERYQLNEGAGTLTVTGSGRPPIAVQHPAQARLLAERAAIVEAYGVAARLLSEAISPGISGGDAYSVFFRGGTVRRSHVASDGSVSVEIELPISSDLAGRVRGVMREREIPGGQAEAEAGISHQEFVARHRIRGPRAITLREWIDRYQARMVGSEHR